MDIKLLLWALAFLCLSGFAVSKHPGMEFAVVFMQNVFPGGSKPRLELLLTSFFPNTKANIQLPRQNFSKVVSLTPGIPTPVELPKTVELLCSARSNMTVRITSNKPISVVAINMRPRSTGVAVVSPIFDWGREYYIMTPDSKLKGSLGQMAVVNGPKPNLISVLLMGLVQLENTTYLPGQQLNIMLGPWESVQIQTNQSLTASHLVSQEDVAVFAGLGCVGINTCCNHIYLQLSATNTWGSNFVVPPLGFGKVTILTARDTQVRLIRGNYTTDVMVAPGMMQEVEVDPMNSLLISSIEKIMVLLNFGKNYEFIASGLLFNLSPIEKACVAYAVIYLPGFNNSVLLAGHKDAWGGLELDHKPLLGLEWRTIDTTELVYTYLPLSHKSYQFISNVGHDFDLVTIGIRKSSSYVIPGTCLDKEYLLCGFECTNPLCNSLKTLSGCVSLASPTCMAWGKTHLLTFFESYMSGSPTCPRILISSQGDKTSRLPFSVERDPSSGVTVRIQVFDQLLEISTDQPGVVLVNKESLYTPINLNDGELTVTRFGFLATVVNASFGLRVIIGDHGFLHLQIAKRYFDGLSGDCVAHSSKEMLNSTGLILDEPVGCNPVLVEDLKLNDKRATANFSNCQIMSRSKVFQSCHLMLDPKPFIKSCKLEVLNGSSSCSAIEAYALACGLNGVHLMEWRNVSHCDLRCPLHSRYEGCSTNCSASCVETELFECDSSLCYEACVCDEGYKISVGSCVPEDECGCYWIYSYYPTVDIYGQECQTRCTCSGPYIDCYQTNGCDVGKTCAFKNNSWFCESFTSSTCILYGDTHYITFDGQDYTFNGFCNTRMAGVSSNNTGLEAFEVHIVQEFVLRTSIKAVNVMVYGKTITFTSDFEVGVMVDGTLVNTPYVVDTSLQIYKSSLGAETLQTDFGLVVSFDKMKRLLIRVPESSLGSVYGLCASMINPVSNEPLCAQYCQGICTNCSNGIYFTKANSSCEIIKDTQGPFGECLQKVDPNPYFEACVNDLCFSFPWCPTLYAYAAACQDAGAVIQSWREETNCGYECPLHATYFTSAKCSYNCPSTCNVDLPLSCELQCQEGCHCDPGYVLSGNSCVPPQKCGCYVNGQYWKSGEIFYDDQCQKRCYCVDDQIICDGHNCTSEEQCSVVLGVRGCYPLSSTCSVSGQSYKTFDGFSYTVDKNCLFVMAAVAGTEELINFEVDLRREVVNDGDLLSAQKAILSVYGYTIIINLDSKGLEVNGNLTDFPVDLDGKIFGFENGSQIVLKTDFGVQLDFNPSMVSLTIPLAYAGMVGGLCGNANTIPSDDTTGLPIDQFLSTWSSYADYTPCEGVFSDDPSSTLAFNARKYCDLIMEAEGPFKECHVLLDPQGFYHNCSSINVNGDYARSICQYIQYYNNECQWAGAPVQPWKNETFCPSDRPPVDALRLTTFSPPTIIPIAPVMDKDCLSNKGPSACWSLNKTSCLFQTTKSFTWLDGVAFQSSPIECSLSLAKVCSNDTALDFFSVYVHYQILGNHSAESLHVEVYGLNIVLRWNRDNFVWVNKIPVSLPACLIPGKLQIRLEGPDIVLEALNGLIIKYDPNGFILIQLPFLYQRSICGKCALKKPHETRIKFTSKISKDSENQCLIRVAKEPWSSNEDSSTSHNLCSMLLEDDGPFSDCHRILNPDHFYGTCQVHVCQDRQSGGNGDAAACHALEAYATLCQLQYGVIKPWRNESFCPFTCPPQGTYELCARTCIQCQNGVCAGPCLEGCNCTEGHLWNGVTCVPSEMCMKSFSRSEMKYLNCDTNSSPNSCRFCTLNYNQISTFGNISSSYEGNGMYDILRKCDLSAPQWLRVVLNLRPTQLAKLHVFYERSFITIDSTLQVWVNGLREVLPVTLTPELYILKAEDVVVLGQPGTMDVSFSSSGDLKIKVAETISIELCGACAIGNLFPNHSLSLESWRAEDLSW